MFTLILIKSLWKPEILTVKLLKSHCRENQAFTGNRPTLETKLPSSCIFSYYYFCFWKYLWSEELSPLSHWKGSIISYHQWQALIWLCQHYIACFLNSSFDLKVAVLWKCLLVVRRLNAAALYRKLPLWCYVKVQLLRHYQQVLERKQRNEQK